MNQSEILDRTIQFFGENILQQIQKQKVLIIGAGALGNEVIKNLLMLGVQHIILVDHDVVELSNLNRCILFRPEHNNVPKVFAIKNEAESRFQETEIIAYSMAISSAPETVWNVPLVIVAVDNNIARWEINRKVLIARHHPFVINGAIARTFIEVQALQPIYTSCMCCSWAKSYFEELVSEYIHSQCDPFYRSTVATHPVISTTTSIAGAIVATEAIKILAGYQHHQETGEWRDKLQPLLGQYIRYDITNHQTMTGKVQRNTKCIEPLCGMVS